MKIEIRNTDPSGTRGYEILDLDNGRHICRDGMFPRFFDEDDVLKLIGDKAYKQFEEGKYVFTVTNKQVYIATGDFRYYLPRFANDREVLNR